MDFYPRSPCGERLHPGRRLLHLRRFLSTLSLRRATAGNGQIVKVLRISIHALLAESDETVLEEFAAAGISIHALLAESDPMRSSIVCCGMNFYPRSPCGERLLARSAYRAILNFYPRSPCGERPSSTWIWPGWSSNFYPRSPCGERPAVWCRRTTWPNFYPRSPCGERHGPNGGARATVLISIHALLAESDAALLRVSQHPLISIHALLAESDESDKREAINTTDFYPRSPCGERPSASA